MNSPGGVRSTVQPMFCSKEKLARIYIKSSDRYFFDTLVKSSNTNVIKGGDRN